ncbi:MAG TPA: phosphoserine phosphatase SerB [Methylocella sp.]|nr:phosphoserine phosphatase SerB [Methylocella sp.]
MSYVATLIGNPALAVLTPDMLAKASEVLSRPAAPQWLAFNVAADIPFEASPGTNAKIVTERIRASLDGEKIDVIVREERKRRKKLLLADMDSTMIREECLDEIADEIGIKAKIAAITERAMRGEVAFEPALRERVGLLKGIDKAAINRVLAKRISLMPGGRTLVQTMRANGAHTVLVSGGFSLFTSAVAGALGFHEDRANELLFDAGGRLSGFVAEPVLGQNAKLQALRQIRDKLKLGKEETLAVGDGANDLLMLEEAGLGVAFHGKPKVAAAAEARIDFADLTSLLYAQGYRRSDFINDAPAKGWPQEQN